MEVVRWIRRNPTLTGTEAALSMMVLARAAEGPPAEAEALSSNLQRWLRS
jgi:hypothetical protein